MRRKHGVGDMADDGGTNLPGSFERSRSRPDFGAGPGEQAHDPLAYRSGGRQHQRLGARQGHVFAGRQHGGGGRGVGPVRIEHDGDPHGAEKRVANGF